MGLRFRKSVGVAKGVKLNFGKKSAGVSVGNKYSGMSFNSKTGTRVRVSAPGTGLSYSTKVGGSRQSHSSEKKPFFKRGWVWAIIVIVVAFLAIPAGGSDDDPAADAGGSSDAEIAAAADVDSVNSAEPDAEPVASEDPPKQEADPEQTHGSISQHIYMGSLESDKAHTAGCRWVKEIGDSNLVQFSTQAEAESAGYSACGTCKPW